MSAQAEEIAQIAGALRDRSDRELTILRAAYHVMAQQGSNRLNLQSIADEAGVSKGLVLYHFKSKNAVLHHAMQWALLKTESRLRDALEHSDGDLLADMLDVIFVSPEANRDFQLVYLDLVEASCREPEFASLPEAVRRIVLGVYTAAIAEGVRRGQLRVDDVAEAALTMRVIIDGSFMQWLQRSDWASSHDTAKAHCLALLRHVFGA